MSKKQRPSGSPEEPVKGNSDFKEEDLTPKDNSSGKDNSSDTKPFVTEDFNLEELRAHSSPTGAPSLSGSDTVRIDKPNRWRFVYVHPSWREILNVIPADEKRKAYAVSQSVAEQFPQFCRAALIVPYASQHGNYFLWPVLLENRTGRISDFSDSAIQRVQEANGRWVRFEADMDNRSYHLYVASRTTRPTLMAFGRLRVPHPKGI